jgi:hypothetical protein
MVAAVGTRVTEADALVAATLTATADRSSQAFALTAINYPTPNERSLATGGASFY